MPFCINCGKEISPEVLFCPNCGHHLQAYSIKQSAQQYGQNGLNGDASTARTLTLVAIIVQIVFFVIGLFVLVGLALFTAVTAVPSSGVQVFSGTTTTIFSNNQAPAVFFPTFGLISLVFVFGFAVSIIWILLDYFLIYNNLKFQSTVSRARTPSFVLGVIQLIFGGLIPGILLIIAYVKIGDSMQKMDRIQ